MEITRLIERCRQGDEDALGELYKAYAQRMRGVCRRYVSDEQTVEDVLHDAFVIIFTSFDRLRDDSKAEAWMMSITRNVASKCKERRGAVTMVPLEEEAGEACGAATLSQHSGQADVKGVPLEDVVRMIDRLPEGYGQVFRLSVFEGMTHKEIADMLGIEPHSSSSQLARAKKMLRRMMQQYWAAVLLLLLVPVTFFLFRKEKPKQMGNSSRVVATTDTMLKPRRSDMTTGRGKSTDNATVDISPEGPTERSATPSEFVPTSPIAGVVTPACNQSSPSGLSATDSTTVTPLLADNQTDTTTVKPSPLDNRGYTQRPPGDTTATGDSTLKECPIILPYHDLADLSTDKPAIDESRKQKWSLELAYAGQFDEQNHYNQPFSYKPTPSATQSLPGPSPSPLIPSTIDNWSDYAVYLANNPDAVSDKTRSVIMRIALNNANRPGEDKILRTSHHQMPVTWSLAVKYRLNRRFGLESGLSYSRLTSDFEMGADGNTIREQQTIHYLGIPVKGIYNMYGGKHWSLYGSLGLTTEIPVRSVLRSDYFVNGLQEAGDKTHFRAPWQFSTTLGLGLHYHLTPSVGFFVEPSLQYFIPTSTDIETYRTEHPFTFSLPLGIRFTW